MIEYYFNHKMLNNHVTQILNSLEFVFITIKPHCNNGDYQVSPENLFGLVLPSPKGTFFLGHPVGTPGVPKRFRL